MSGQCFVTVGTTCFDDLIRAADSLEFVRVLKQQGYTSLLLQIGRGTYIPGRVVPPGVTDHVDASGFRVQYFTFKPATELSVIIASAALVVSHAGSGSIFEALQAKRPLVVVVNDKLMDNHQQELAAELSQRRHLVCTKPESLRDAVANLRPSALEPYTPGNPREFARELDSLMGICH